jgi:hypothetical protein
MTSIEYFLPEDDVERGSLRQGDVLADVQRTGALTLHEVEFSHRPGADPTSWTVKVKPDIGPAMVLSHSCELDRANGVKVTAIVLAPVRDVDSATSPENIQKLIQTNFLDPDAPAATFLKYFFFPEIPSLPFKGGSVADFSKLFSARKASYDYLLQRKVAQLTPRAAAQMALKLSAYFFRDADIIRAAGTGKS